MDNGTDAEVIWEAFQRSMGKAFFYKEIEKEFGITPETHKNLIVRFDRKIVEH